MNPTLTPDDLDARIGLKDVAAIRANAARLLERMSNTPHGPKRKRLAEQHVDAINDALRAEGYNDAVERMARSSTSSGDVAVKVAELDDYDAGLLNVYGGGDTGWWLDYIRAEIGRANDFWREQLSALSTPALAPQPSSETVGELARLQQELAQMPRGGDREDEEERAGIKERIAELQTLAQPSSASVGGVSEDTDTMTWRDGEPPKPWRDEWFIAVTKFGDRVVLKALPEEFTYDYKTADETYIKAENIAKWMQFPDSQFVPPPKAATTAKVGEITDTAAATVAEGDGK